MNKKTIFTVMAFTVLLFSGFIHATIPAHERAALIALYNSTNGDSWNNNSGWKTPPLELDGFGKLGPDAHWEGVAILGDHVSAITLSYHQLTGSIPSQLENLSQLRLLALHGNQLSGSIPSELGNLSNLEGLILGSNQLSGSIPTQLGNLASLKNLYLWGNQLSGRIPSQLGYLDLKNIWLFTNQLSGSIPPELGNLNNLTQLFLHDNQLSGSIPTQLGNLSDLYWLSLNNNQLSGSIPSQLGNLSNLEQLYLQNNRLSGEIPTSFINLSRIIPGSLRLSYNCLFATDPVLRDWLYHHVYDGGNWEEHQDQCGDISSIAGRLQIKNTNGQPWAIDNVQLDSYVSISGMDKQLKINADGTYSSSDITIAPGVYTITAKLNYNDYIIVNNGNTPPPSGNKKKRTAVLTMTNFKVEQGSNTLDFDYQLPVFLIHGIRSGYKMWNNWADYLTDNGFIVFTPNHHYKYSDVSPFSKENEAVEISTQYNQDINNLFIGPKPDVFFICHSEGGVATRVLVNKFPDVAKKIKKIYAIGTPHSGTDFLGAGIYGLSRDQMVGFNEDYPNFNNVPVYAFSGHGSIFPKRNDCDFINDSVVFWISEELDLRNCSPFSIKVRKGFWSYENTKGGEFDGFHPKCKANFHHFCYEHSNLIGDGMSCLLINTIIPLMQGKSPKKCNTCDSNGNASQNAPASESANFPVFNELFYLGSNSSKTIQVNISSTDTATFTAFSEGMDIELSLTDPGGQKITSTNYSSNTSIKYSKTHWGIQYSIANPKAGAWKVKVTAKNCNDYVAVGVYEKTTWTILGASNKTNYYPNSQAILNAKIDGTSGGVNITTFQATTYDENQVEISTINLYDDGKHNDQSAGDGIFGNAYNTPNQEGYYRLKFHAESSAKEQRESSGGYTVTGSLPSSEITLSRSNMYFGAAGQSFTSTQNVLISNKGSGILNWSASSNVSWLNFSPSSGIGASVFSVSANPSGLAAGIYTGTITITDPNASNSPQSISVRLQVYNPGTTAVPFGEFATPAEGSQAYGSVPVTGWALDDVEVANVKIYNGDLYIGEALLVEGARPDVEQTHPEHPMNYRAGWGYMMLTNFLPNNGNGTFKIHAVATDLEGHQVTLGTKTIICDNANAVKPFGSIDTPTQGGTASGNNFINWGWVLTPQPNKIPTDGSTINVYVDGVNLGHPTYNIYRSDIAQLFPGYNNSDGAAGFLSFDTTSYTNGVHTMQWTATDNGGNSDGIGSRYFTIQNTGNSQSKAQTTSSGKIVTGQKFFHLSQIVDIPLNDSESIRVKRGLKDNIEPELVSADESGDFIIKIKELERLVIEFSKKSALIEGYTIVRDELRPLPIGSIIDFKEKKFYWQPGPGFVGYYRFVFIERSEDNQINRKHIIVKIETKSMK